MYDFCFLIIMGTALLIGYKGGFLRSVVGFASVIASAFGGFLLYPYVTDILIKTPLYSGIVSWLSGLLTNRINEEALPEMFIKYNADTFSGVVLKMAEGIAVVILNIISIIIILVLIRVLFHFLKKTAKWINKLPVIGLLNRILGMVFSGASVIIVIYIIVAVIVLPPSNETEFSKEVCRNINNSFIVSRVMDYNFFVSYKSLSNVD